MNIKTLAICLYIMLIYWLSLKFPSLHMLFFPTLGAFSFLFITRPWNLKELSKIALGAIISSIVGTVLFHLSPGVISIFSNTLITIWLIHTFKWNAPPILAVSFIPFFTQSPNLWALPLAVCVSISGLIITLSLVYVIEKKEIALRIRSLVLRRKDGQSVGVDAYETP
ncbi:hypothetical protein D3C73_525890 [compost metagenome]